MTRGAKKTEHHEEPDDAEPGTSADQQGAAAASKPDKLEELASLVKSLVRSQASRDQQMEKESTRQEQRWRSMQHQFLQIQTQVRELRGDHEDRAEHHDGDDDDDGEDLGVMASQQNEPPPPPRAPHVHRDAKLIPLSPDDDIEHYLTTFERMATVCRWPKEEWAIQLVPLLTDFILHADAEDLKKPEISVQNSGSGGEVDLSCQTKLKHLPSGTNVICNLYIGDSSQPFRSTWTKHKDKVCIFIVKRDDLKQGLQSVGATEVSCDYSVPTDPRSPSPRSDKRKIEGLSPGTSTFSEADKKTTSPPAVTTKKTWLNTPAGIGVILTVIVILLGMTGACLYWIHRKRKSSGLPTTPNNDAVYTTVDVSKGAGSSDATSPSDVTYSTVAHLAPQTVAFHAQQDNVVYSSLKTD